MLPNENDFVIGDYDNDLQPNNVQSTSNDAKPIVTRRFIEVECCMKCPNKFPTMSNKWRCKAKDGVYPLPEQGVHIDCPLPIINGV